jgi:D-alanine-D-alanine ligase
MGPEVLPAAEILFKGFSPEKPRIVGSAAKWDEHSFEYHATVRSFELRAEDGELAERLRRPAVACWRALGLRGYARVDFRVDEEGQPWILEANANPCLSPDAGFAAAAAHGGLSFDDVIERILKAA